MTCATLTCAADLSGADLSGADLRGADLRGADLSGADSSGADLREQYVTLNEARSAQPSSFPCRHVGLYLLGVITIFGGVKPLSEILRLFRDLLPDRFIRPTDPAPADA